MTKTPTPATTRRELADRWRGIEEDLEEPQLHPLKQRTLRQLKEQWFADAFGFLMAAPADSHLWCGFWDLMVPLLETFHGFPVDKEKRREKETPLEALWKRASREMRRCTQCVCQHWQAQDTYRADYEPDAVEPLLEIMRRLDRERVLAHLLDINAAVKAEVYDLELYSTEVVSLVFEILTFPVLLEDQLVITEFESFIEAIDNCHELSLAGDQQYPGVYALLFLRSAKARAIGLRLAGSMGKLRNAADLEPLQPLLSKYIGVLETEVLPLNSDSSRSRVQLERLTVWLGFKALLAFLEPAAFEDGILERYPIFLSIVLNHVSDDTPEFTFAVTCLRLFFQMLGCKLWLRTTLSPSMMRNTLLGQCFHTSNEKSHKEIFDLFLPFLQSLEALQDGEYEKQRRHFLYFLLHQVTKSSNFSLLMRQNACKIALLIVQRGYQMNPPCPPFECCHMWGSSLVESLKDSSLHSSLRQPAIDLAEAIIISDCAALVSLRLGKYASTNDAKYDSCDPFNDDDKVPFSYESKESLNNCWQAFSFQSKITARECKDWRCIPALWIDIFVQLDPPLLPLSICKAVLWVLSHLSMAIPDSSIDMKILVSDWLTTEAAELSSSFEWEVPKGFDDGEDGNEPKNSVSATFMWFPLIRVFKRCVAHFFVLMEQRACHKLFTWESRMAESLILLLVEPNDILRQLNRLILEHISKIRGLTPSLQFLCSNPDSLCAVNMGLRYAIKLAQLDSDLKSFPGLHHLFFVIRKLLKEVPPSLEISPTASLGGGFLHQPYSVCSQVHVSERSSPKMDATSWNKFSSLLSESIWPLLLKCLKEGQKFIDDKESQMTSVRMLETLPVIFENIFSIPSRVAENSVYYGSEHSNLNWLFVLIDWGRSSLAVVFRHWKQHMPSMVNIIEKYHGLSARDLINNMQEITSCDVNVLNQLKEQLSQYLQSLSKEVSYTNVASLDRNMVQFVESPLWPSEKKVRHIVDTLFPVTCKTDMIVISDDEDEKKISLKPVINKSQNISSQTGKETPVIDSKGQIQNLSGDSIVLEKLKIHSIIRDVKDLNAISGIELDNSIQSSKAVLCSNEKPETTVKLKGNAKREEKKANQEVKNSLPGLSKSCKTNINFKMQIIKENIEETVNDPLEEALTSASNSRLALSKPSISVPKRKVIQLQPTAERPDYPSRMQSVRRRHIPPKLDDWYKPILEFDYFSASNHSSNCEGKPITTSSLQQVPLCFNSPNHYVEIFRPLVLEEFKAQVYNSYVENSLLDDISCLRLSVISVERIDDFHLVRGSPENSESLTSKGHSENDLILLTKDPLQNSSHSLYALGKIERRERSNKSRSIILTIRFYLPSSSMRLLNVKLVLMERSKWHISHIMSMTPQLREFQVLSSLNDVPLMPIILKPVDFSTKCTGFLKTELAMLSLPLRSSLKSSFNDSQLQAVGVAIGNKGFTKANELSLIQGPPGTGKTRTIVAIVSVLLALNHTKSDDTSRLQNRSSALVEKHQHFNVNAAACQTAAIARAWQDLALAKQLIQQECKSDGGSMSLNFKRRILVCAQSNAAVDELVARISCGIYGNDGKLRKPYIVRVGNLKTVHPSSLPFFIDTLVQQQLEECTNEADLKKSDIGMNSSALLRTKLEKIVENIRLLESLRAKLRDSDAEMKNSLNEKMHTAVDGMEISEGSIGSKLNRLYSQKKAIYAELAVAQTSENKKSEEIRLLRIKIRRSIIREAEVVVSTLSGCGGDIYGVCSEDASSSKVTKFSEYSLFDAVVIDEAAQALEPATLIPLQLLKSSGAKCIMVGDPKQLPATVLSNVACKFSYECSMFERLQKAGYPFTMLTQQYRMHPEICKFPSLHFYDRKLINGAELTKFALFHENLCFRPYVFYDVVDGRQQSGKGTGSLSVCNEAEAEAAVELLKFLRNKYPSEFVAGRIGIVTPYKRQLSVLRLRFSNEFGPEIIANMEFNTVDGFQGREVDILLLSTVRASEASSGETAIKARSIGFVSDARRMNVALTRAKLSLWIFGHARTLQMNAHWADLVQDAKARNLFVSISKPYKGNFKNLLSSTSPKKSGETQNVNKSVDHHYLNPIKTKARKKKGGNDHFFKQKVNLENANLHTGYGSGSQKSSCYGSTSSRAVFADHKINDRENFKVSSKHTKSSDFSAETEAIRPNAQTKDSTNKTKKKNRSFSEKSPGESLAGNSIDPNSCGNQQLERAPENTKSVGNPSVKSADSNLSRKRQREAVNALLSSSLISSKKFDPSRSATVKHDLTNLASAKADTKAPKKSKS